SRIWSPHACQRNRGIPRPGPGPGPGCPGPGPGPGPGCPGPGPGPGPGCPGPGPGPGCPGPGPGCGGVLGSRVMTVPYLCVLAAYALVYLPRFVFVTPAMVRQGYDNAEP